MNKEQMKEEERYFDKLQKEIMEERKSYILGNDSDLFIRRVLVFGHEKGRKEREDEILKIIYNNIETANKRFLHKKLGKYFCNTCKNLNKIIKQIKQKGSDGK